MGNRDDLLTGALQCLYERGYARTTARDIAAAAGVGLGAIGYHFGTKEKLLNAALRQAIEDWGDDIARASGVGAEAGSGPDERFEDRWDSIVRSFEATRPLWAMQFELLAHIERTPDLREQFREAGRQARAGLAELFADSVPADDPERARAFGACLQALLLGAAGQWMTDPEGTLSGHDLLTAVRAIASATSGSGAA